MALMDPVFTNRVVAYDYVHQILSKLVVFLPSKTKVMIKQLKTQLKSIKKQGVSASKYVLKIKKVANYLAVVGAPISTNDHVEGILDGLNEEYSSLITTVLSRSNPFLVDGSKALLMA